MPQIRINLENCDGCGACIALCPASVLAFRNGRVEVVNPEACLEIKAKQDCSECDETEEVCVGCVACVRNCPMVAIEIIAALREQSLESGG